jgi:hypothetical protein
MKNKCLNLHTNDTNTDRGAIDFFQGQLIFLFIISISLHNLPIVSGFFLLNNNDSFNVFGLMKQYFGIRFFLSDTKFGHCNT